MTIALLAWGSAAVWAAPAVPTPAVAGEVRIVAKGMCCKGCARKVASKLYTAPGVKSVAVDLKNHLVVVTPARSTALSLPRLWEAVQGADGDPSQLATETATYTLTKPERLAADQRPPQGILSIVVDDLESMGTAQMIADRLYAIRGVKSVRADLDKKSLYVEITGEASPSPWALIDAVEKAKKHPSVILGPHGALQVTYATAKAALGRSAPYQR